MPTTFKLIEGVGVVLFCVIEGFFPVEREWLGSFICSPNNISEKYNSIAEKTESG